MIGSCLCRLYTSTLNRNSAALHDKINILDSIPCTFNIIIGDEECMIEVRKIVSGGDMQEYQQHALEFVNELNSKICSDDKFSISEFYIFIPIKSI